MTNGEQTYSNLIDSVATTFFPWNDPQFPLGNASPWVSAILSIIFTGILTPFGLLAGAGVQEASYALQPSPGATLLVDKLTLENSLASWGSDARATIDSWANTTFAGGTDQEGNTILYGINATVPAQMANLCAEPTSKAELLSIQTFYQAIRK
jgi:hypothetical protein